MTQLQRIQLSTLLRRAAAVAIAACFFGVTAPAATRTVVADSLTRSPLSGASVFDRSGNFIGVSGDNGSIPALTGGDYPVTVRYIGYDERIVDSAGAGDTIFLAEKAVSLPEVVVESGYRPLLHVLAYVREYSTLSSYTDTIIMFREKMVDYMLNDDEGCKFKGWNTPRVLKSKSYYRFTDSHGTDSVSDRCNQHFTWTDWIGIPPAIPLPAPVDAALPQAADTVRGKYSPAEIWQRRDDRLFVDIDVLADSATRKWVPYLNAFFKNNIDFERFRLHTAYRDIAGTTTEPLALTGYSFNIQSRGRGFKMFQFHRYDQPFFIDTYTEVYILDKEFITVKEGKRWQGRHFDNTEIEIIEPSEAPRLNESTLQLIARVNGVDNAGIRLSADYNSRFYGREVKRHSNNLGKRAFTLLKDVTGITLYKSRKNFKRNGNKFSKRQLENNARRDTTSTGN